MLTLDDGGKLVLVLCLSRWVLRNTRYGYELLLLPCDTPPAHVVIRHTTHTYPLCLYTHF